MGLCSVAFIALEMPKQEIFVLAKHLQPLSSVETVATLPQFILGSFGLINLIVFVYWCCCVATTTNGSLVEGRHGPLLLAPQLAVLMSGRNVRAGEGGTRTCEAREKKQMACCDVM